MRLGRDSILSMTHRGLRAGQVVGIVATPYCRLEILPKVDSNSQEVSRRSLFSMIAYTLGLNISVGGYFEGVRQSSGILEVLIRRFSEDLYVAVHRGLPRRYLTKEEDLTRLRGQLDTIRQITRFAASPHILATRFDQLDRDIPINQILKAACIFLRNHSNELDNQKRLSQLIFAFDGISDLDLSWPLPVSKIHLDRTNSHYKQLLNLALLFLKGNTQAIYSGNGAGFSLLFEMNILFEEFVGQVTKRLQSKLDCDVNLQGPHDYALLSSEGERKFRTKPDIHLRHRPTNEIIIVDTKWKHIKKDAARSPWGVSSSDVYQMLAYAEVYDADMVILLYPHPTDWEEEPGILEILQSKDGSRLIAVATFDIIDIESASEQILNIVGSLKSQDIAS